jgi:hypothetical protein
MNPDQSSAAGPYRTPPAKVARFVCIVCYRTATTDEPGECPCTKSPRLPLDNPEVVEMVRAKVAAIRQRRLGWKMAGAFVLTVAIALGICLAFGLSIAPRSGLSRGGSSWFLWLMFLGFPASASLVTGYLDHAPPTDTQELLRWLGVRIEDR